MLPDIGCVDQAANADGFEQLGSSDSREAMTAPADPPPITIKSYSSGMRLSLLCGQVGALVVCCRLGRHLTMERRADGSRMTKSGDASVSLAVGRGRIA